MGKIWLPNQSPAAMALREPNLLVPGRKPGGQVKLKPGTTFAAFPELVVPLGIRQAATLEAGASIANYPDSRYGLSWHTETSQNSDDTVIFNGSSDIITTNQFTIFVIYTPATTAGRMSIFSSFDTAAANRILIRRDSSDLQFYIRTSTNSQVGLSGVDQGLNHTCLAFRYDNTAISNWANGQPAPSYSNYRTASGGFNSATAGVDFRIGYLGSSALGFVGDVSAIVVLNYAETNAACEEVTRTSDLFRYVEPANQTPYLISVPAGGAAYTLTAASGSFTLTGNAATLSRGYTLTAAAGAHVLTGKTATLKIGRSLSAAVGSYALTGNAATLNVGRSLTAGAASFALSGKAAGLARGLSMPASTATMTLTGKAAGLIAARKLSGGLGSFTHTGKAATLKRGFAVVAAKGTIDVTGIAAGLRATRLLTAGKDLFTLTGIDASLVYSAEGAYSITADKGAFTLTGVACDLLSTRTMPATTAAYTFTGKDLDLLIGRQLSGALGSFTLTGVDSTLTYSGEGAYSVVASKGAFTLTGIAAGLSYSEIAVLGDRAVLVSADRDAVLVASDRNARLI